MPTFIVMLQQYVERTAAVEIEAETWEEARDKVLTGISLVAVDKDAITATWEDGDDAYDVDVYPVKKADGELVWER